MARIGPFRWDLALAFILVIQQSLATEGVCRTGCRGASHTFKYAQGTTYRYLYHGKIEITLSSAEGQVTSTEVKATVLLTQLADCNQLLRLQDVQILGSDGKKLGTIPDVEKPIRINVNDGQVDDSICIESGDTQNSLNLKRAIASIFQAKLKSGYETDVFGVCPTDVSSHQEGGILVIRKSRNLNKCAYRENIKQDFFTTVFDTNSEIKSSPILNGEYSSKLQVKAGVLDQASIVENYLYVPFSVGKNGAKAQVTSKLHLAGTSKDNPKPQANKPRSIIFENPHPVVAPTSNVNKILIAVKDVLKTIDIVVGEETAKGFATLVKTLRAAKKGDLLSVYNQVKSGVGFSDKHVAKKIYLDGLLKAGTADAVEAAITLLKNREFNDVEKKFVYIGLSLVRHASESSLTAAAGLLSQSDLPHEAYLGIGNLAGRFCRQHACEGVDAVKQLSQKLVQKLGDGKPSNKAKENDIIYALKALRNINYFSDAALQKIVSIAQDKSAPNRVRAVALETYLADPCKDKLRNSALNVLQDIQQDSEIRIKAYLAAVQCPNAKVGNAVKALLEKEPSYQVGGFIVSHIRSVKASANPDKELAKKYLGFTVPKRFPIDLRKWSYNGELSYAFDSIGLASSSEANIIYSQDSFLPRSTSLNLTAQVFGHTFNFLEIQTRQENLDKLVEHYFGPKGILSTSSFGDLLKNNDKVANKVWKYLSDKLDDTLRSRRDVSRAEIENIGKAVQIKENALNKDFDLDFSLKAFGSEVLFTNVNIYEKGLTPEAIIDKIMANFAQGLDKLKKFKETLRSNFVFLDAEFDYPTSLGFPLRLASEGTASISVEAEGNVDGRAIIDGYDNVARIKLVPSANIEVNGRLTLDALVVENGLKVASTLYTATGGDLTIESFLGITGRDIKFSLPVPIQKLISANHEIVFHTREQSGHEVNSPLKFAQSKDFSICVDHLSPFIGLAFCGEINGPNLVGKDIPNLPFPLAGDAKFAVSIENEDALEYHLRSKVDINFNSLQLLVETIGKNRQQKVKFQVNAEIQPEHYITATFSSPLKTAYAEARIINNNNEKSLFAKASYDQTEVYGKLGVAISGSPSRASYRPILDFKGPGGSEQLPLNIEGQVIVEKQGPQTKYIFDNVRVRIPDGRIISLKGNIGNDQDAVFTDLTVSEGPQSATVKSRVHLAPNLFKFNAEVQNTVNPGVNFNLKGEFKRNLDDAIDEAFLQLIHGQDLSSKTNKISLSGSLTRKFTNPPVDFIFGSKLAVNYPLVGLDYKFEFRETPKSLEYDLDFQYAEIKFGSELDVTINKKQKGDFEVDFEVHGLENQISFSAERQVHGDSSKINNELEVNGKKLEVKGTIKHVIKPANIDVGAVLTVVVPSHNTPFKVDSGLKYNANEIDAHHKVTSGSTVVVDAFIKANKQLNANGSFKVNIKDILNVNGQLKANKGTGTADILIDVQKLKKQVKFESSFQIQPASTYDVDFTLYPTYGQNKQEKLVFSTHNKLSPNSVESKSSVNLLGKKSELNFKGSSSGDQNAGKNNAEFEVSFPNDQYLLGRLNSDHQKRDSLSNGLGLASLEYRTNKNAPGKKVSVKATYRNTDVSSGVYDIVYALAADDSNGNNINADINLKRSKQDQERFVEYSAKVYGSSIQPVTSNLKINYNLHQTAIEASGTCGNDVSFKFGSKYAESEQDKASSGDLNIEVKTPNKHLKVLKLELGSSVKKPGDTLEYKSYGNIFADDDGTNPDPIIDFKGDSYLKTSDKEGEVKSNVNYGKFGPLSASGSYKIGESGKQLNGNAAIEFGSDKHYKVQGKLSRPSDHQYKLDVELDTPYKDYQKTKVSVQTQRSQDNKHVTSKVVFNADGRVYNVDSEFQLSEESPLVDIKAKNPDGKTSQIYIKINKVSDKKFTSEVKLLCESINFVHEGNLDVNIESVDEFYIKANVHSPQLNINKYSSEIQNKPGKTGRRIQINIKSAGRNIVSGNTNYNLREEQGKYIVEGSGTLKVKEESKAANFKYISQRLTKEKNGEKGIEIIFNGGVGERAIDSEFKLTDKQLRILDSYCEKRKECANFELDFKLNSVDIDSYDHILEVNVDLRKLGLPHEFGLKAVTKRQQYVFDHTTDVHFQSADNNKYQYSVYYHPKEAGVSLTTPKRIISLEAKSEYPQNLKEGGRFSGEVSLYLDKKNQPNKKASVEGWLNIDAQQKTLNGEAKLVHPGLPRALHASVRTETIGTPIRGQVSFAAELDVFAQQNQKLVAYYSYVYDTIVNFNESFGIKSAGLGVDIHLSEEGGFNSEAGEYTGKIQYHIGNTRYDNVAFFQGDKSQLNLHLRILNVDLLKASNRFNIGKDEQIIDSEVSSYDNQPVISHFELKNWNTLLYTVGRKNNPREKLQFNAGLIPGQIADVRSDHITASGKVNLYQASIKLDDANFLKPDYSVNSKEIEAVLDKTKNNVFKFVSGLQNVGKEFSNDIRKEFVQIGEVTKTGAPNLQPLKEYYVSELQKIKEELLQDKSIKELVDAFKNVFGTIVQSVSEIVSKFSELVQSVVESVQQAFVGVFETIQNELLPQLKVLADKLIAVASDIVKSAVEILAGYLATISQLIEKYQPEIKQIASIFGELGQDVGRFIQKSYRQVSEIIAEVARKIYDELKALPIFEELKAQYQEFLENGLPSKEGIIGGIREIAATIKDLIPADFFLYNEISQIIELTVEYIEKKLKQEPVDDLAILEKIASIEALAVKKILSTFVSPKYDVPQSEVPVTLDFLRKIPKLVAIKFSPIPYLLNEDPSDAVAAYLLSLLNNPRQWVPPFPLFGIISQGQHIFTFDGKYYTFPGTCKYLLARDAVNGNFTIVGTYEHGRLSAITLADPHDSITVQKGGQVLLNNAATDLPARKQEIAAYRDYSMVYLISSAGAKVACTPDLEGCGIYVSGFYHAQLKGLLGVGNNEPYDDFTAANGKIVVSEGDFANSFKIGSCQPVAVLKNDQKAENAECNKLFSWESPLRYCYAFVPTENYKVACAHGLNTGVKDTQLNIAKAYVAACQVHNIPIRVPSDLVKCTNGDKPYSVGDTFSVKLPGKAADIILIVDTTKENEPIYKDLFQPLVLDLGKTLQSKGISDVQFHIIAYGGDNKWPSHVTVSGKLTFKGKSPNLKFAEVAKKENSDPEGILIPLKPYLDTFHSILHDVKLAFGLDLQAETFSEAYVYPFRPHALKSILILNNRTCEVGKLFLLQRLRTLIFKNNQVTINLITPFNELSVKDAKKTKDVIGFNENHVFTISQAKKKPEGVTELHKELDYNDYCVDFTVRNRGNVFVTNNFVDAKPDAKKQFIHVAAYNIANELVSVEEGLECECRQVSPYEAYNVCSEEYAKEK